jgi:hypothetical protein
MLAGSATTGQATFEPEEDEEDDEPDEDEPEDDEVLAAWPFFLSPDELPESDPDLPDDSLPESDLADELSEPSDPPDFSLVLPEPLSTGPFRLSVR